MAHERGRRIPVHVRFKAQELRKGRSLPVDRVDAGIGVFPRRDAGIAQDERIGAAGPFVRFRVDALVLPIDAAARREMSARRKTSDGDLPFIDAPLPRVSPDEGDGGKRLPLRNGKDALFSHRIGEHKGMKALGRIRERNGLSFGIGDELIASAREDDDGGPPLRTIDGGRTVLQITGELRPVFSDVKLQYFHDLTSINSSVWPQRTREGLSPSASAA